MIKINMIKITIMIMIMIMISIMIFIRSHGSQKPILNK